MNKKPLRPILFIPAYLLSMAMPITPSFFGQKITIGWIAFGISLTLLLQLWWAYRATVLVSELASEGNHVRRSRSAVQFVLTMLVLSIVLAAFYHWYVEPHFVGSSLMPVIGIESPVWGLPVALLFFATFWFSARALCEAEGSERAPAHSIIGTFLLFVYIIIGAPFIYRRLKRLQYKRDMPNRT